jgi:hypothetical protein
MPAGPRCSKERPSGWQHCIALFLVHIEEVIITASAADVPLVLVALMLLIFGGLIKTHDKTVWTTFLLANFSLVESSIFSFLEVSAENSSSV